MMMMVMLCTITAERQKRGDGVDGNYITVVNDSNGI